MSDLSEEAKRHFRLAKAAIKRLETTSNEDRTTMTIIKHLKAFLKEPRSN